MIAVWATTVAIVATWLLLLWWWVRHDRRRSSRKKVVAPPGSLGLPFVGESLQLIWAFRSSDPEPFLDLRRSRYGSVFTTHVFGKRTVFSTDAEVNRFILQNEGRLFEACYPSSISTLLGRHSLLVMPSVLPLHRRLHSVTLNFASRHAALLSHIDRLVRRALLSWPSNGRLLLHPHAKKITFELTVKQLLGLDPGEWSEKVRKQYLRLIDGFFCLPLPLPFTTYGNALKARAKVAEELRTVVRSRREQLQRRQNQKENKNETDMEMEEDDMLGLLMGDAELSEEHMVDMLLSLLVAGYETTSTIMTLCVKFLTETPLALAQLKEEHDTIRSSSSSKSDCHEKLEWGDYKAMTFTQCVINETLRIANIIAGVFRRALVDSEIKGYTIPQGWMVFPCFRAVHLDQDNYEDARKFNPWRWQQQPKGSSLAANASFGPNFTPFGGGPRLCPGYELARVEISVFLHHLVTMFSWTAAEHDELIFFPTTRTKKNFPIMLTRRKLPKSIAT